MSAERFFDTNVVLYALIEDSGRMAVAKQALADGGLISVQVLNELTNTLRRKFRLSWDEVGIHIETIVGLVDDVRPLSAVEHVHARDIAERFQLQFYDSLLLASALEAGCTRFVSEDMQDGLVVEGLTINNPFRS